MRDDFNQNTKDTLANRVGWRCSNPGCRKPTRGPSKENGNTDIANIGVAAHICAASAGGPRYDENMTEEERKSFDNGIWLCQSCSKLIDSDVVTYTVAVLKEWKSNAEKMAAMELQQRMPLNNVSPQVDIEISSGKMLKEYFFSQINKYKIWNYLSCDTKTLPLYLNDVENVDCFIRIISETMKKCYNSCDNIEWKKVIEIYVYILFFLKNTILYLQIYVFRIRVVNIFTLKILITIGL